LGLNSLTTLFLLLFAKRSPKTIIRDRHAPILRLRYNSDAFYLSGNLDLRLKVNLLLGIVECGEVDLAIKLIMKLVILVLEVMHH